MKTLMKTCWIAIAVLLSSSVYNNAKSQPSGYSISYQTFYDELSPYGDWIDYPEYGYVWAPRMRDFRPYQTNGHWIWTNEYGWMWASDYDWGWAPFHYGRWTYDDWYGWVWVPGYEWSPAWVQWRTGGDYYGWAPLGPGFNIQLGFDRYSAPDYYWNFVPRNYLTSSRIYDYCEPWSRNVTYINTTTIINSYDYGRYNNVFVTGPDRYEFERYTHQRISPFDLRQSGRPGRTICFGNQVDIYRPQVLSDSKRHSPTRFERYDHANRGSIQPHSDINTNGINRGNNFDKSRQYPSNGFEQRREIMQQPGRMQQQQHEEIKPDLERQQQNVIEQQPAKMQRERSANGFERRQSQWESNQQRKIEKQQNVIEEQPAKIQRERSSFEQRRQVEFQQRNIDQGGQNPSRFERQTPPGNSQSNENRFERRQPQASTGENTNVRRFERKNKE